MLFQKAKEVTKTKENFKVTDIIFDNNSNIKGVCGLHNNNLRHIYAPLIFGCDGSQSIIAKKM